MSNLAVDIADVHFKNPFVVGSSSLTNDFTKVRQLIDAGAGAVITKTISPFALTGIPESFATGRFDRSLAVVGDPRMSMDEGKELIRRTSEYSDVPIIANVIGRSADLDVWLETCTVLQDAGATMVELDLNCHPDDGLDIGVPPSQTFYNAASIGQDPQTSAEVVRHLAQSLRIPIVAKLTLRAHDQLAVAKACHEAGASAISGVNAMHGLADVLLDSGRPAVPGHESYSLAAVCGPDLAVLGTKWTALLSKYIDAPYISGSGVATPEDALGRILLGAHAVSVCWALYTQGPRFIADTLTVMDEYLSRVGASSWADVRGTAARRLVESRPESARRSVVARVADAQLWADCGPDVFQRSHLQCPCIRKSGDCVELDEELCTGCGLVYFNAPQGAVAMVERN